MNNVSQSVVTLVSLILGIAMLVVKVFAPSIPANVVELVVGICMLVSVAFHIPIVQATVAQAKLNSLARKKD